jgi:nickel-dependent lactate racemase
LKAVFAVEPLIKDGGCIILPAQCEDGLGPDLFEEWMTSVSFSEEFSSKIDQEGYSPKIDHCYLLAKIIIVVSSHPRVKDIDFLESVCDIEQALSIALQRMGKDAKIIATPYSTRLLVVSDYSVRNESSLDTLGCAGSK